MTILKNEKTEFWYQFRFISYKIIRQNWFVIETVFPERSSNEMHGESLRCWVLTKPNILLAFTLRSFCVTNILAHL